MLRILKNKDGSVMILTAISLVALLGFAALAIDVGAMYTAKNQLQAAVDSAALAGASGLIVNDNGATATTRANQFAGLNNCINLPVAAPNATVTVSFPVASRIRVDAVRPMNLYFARVLGINTANITAFAEAELAGLVGAGHMRPWAIPDLNYIPGQLVLLKAGAIGAPSTNTSFYYAVDFPPLGYDIENPTGDPLTGTSVYNDWIYNGYNDWVYIDQWLQVEPGNMQADIKAVNDLIDLDPTASWTGDGFYSPFGSDSPRVITVALYDPLAIPPSGRSAVQVEAFAEFFLSDVMEHKGYDAVYGEYDKGDVFGYFIRDLAEGVPGTGSPSLSLGVHLVR